MIYVNVKAYERPKLVKVLQYVCQIENKKKTNNAERILNEKTKNKNGQVKEQAIEVCTCNNIPGYAAI